MLGVAAFAGQMSAAVLGTVLATWAAYLWKVSSKHSAPTGEDKLFVFELLIAAGALLVSRSVQTAAEVLQDEGASEPRVAVASLLSRIVLLIVIFFVGATSANWIRHNAYVSVPGGHGVTIPTSTASKASLMAAGFLLCVFLLDFFLPSVWERLLS